MSKPIPLKKFRHKVWLCTEQDIIVSPGSLEIARPPVFSAGAVIEEKRQQQFGSSGLVAHDERERPSHVVTIRFRPDVDIRSTAWLYEERLQSGRRWWKVLGHGESECARYFILTCRLIEKGVAIPAPTTPAPATATTLPTAAPLPPGVQL